ncbi:MAG: hypothetical protein ACM3PY_09875 [Omnitrophica WOR_2 bacterium]
MIKMLNPGDLVSLPHTTDLVRASMDSVWRTLPYRQLGSGNQQQVNLQQMIVDQMCEFSLRRYLSEKGIPHHIQQVNLFPGPDQYQIRLGGRNCFIRGALIMQGSRDERIKKQPDPLLTSCVYVPKSFFASEFIRENDPLIFLFILGYLAVTPREIQHALAARQPVALCHIFPDAWIHPKKWVSLCPVEIVNQTRHAATFEAGGQMEDLRFESERIALEPEAKAQFTLDFFSLAYLQTSFQVDKPVGVTRRGWRKNYWISPHQWHNLWIYGIDIRLAGFLTCDEFRRRAIPANATGKAHAGLSIPTNCLALPVLELHPFSQLGSLANYR